VKLKEAIKICISLMLSEIANCLHLHDEYLKMLASDISTANGIEWHRLNFTSAPPASNHLC